MRESLLFIALSLFVSGSAINSRAQDLQVIKDSEAAQYVGKNVEVRGLVVAVYTSKKGNTFLNFGAKYPNQTFTGYIPAGAELGGDRWTITLQGKVIGITGTVEMYQGKPEIKVLSMSQIKGADSQPVAQ
jgi:DNA/RNA endonuclease YhcR with UshA esterase domain